MERLSHLALWILYSSYLYGLVNKSIYFKLVWWKLFLLNLLLVFQFLSVTKMTQKLKCKPHYRNTKHITQGLLTSFLSLEAPPCMASTWPNLEIRIRGHEVDSLGFWATVYCHSSPLWWSGGSHKWYTTFQREAPEFEFHKTLCFLGIVLDHFQNVAIILSSWNI